ncbi:MAG: hypothetical protein CL424_01905 [Acidimicrobiaceae bacterium]|nr:hypothetical protein [Acidimicrobiaceae bacterium]
MVGRFPVRRSASFQCCSHLAGEYRPASLVPRATTTMSPRASACPHSANKVSPDGAQVALPGSGSGYMSKGLLPSDWVSRHCHP